MNLSKVKELIDERESLPEAAELRGVVAAVYYSDENFTAGNLKSGSGPYHRFAGRLSVSEGDAVILRGKFERGKYGVQFRADGFEYDLALDRGGIIRYLARNPEMKGIGRRRAELIADFCGEDFDEIVANRPGELLAVKGVTEEIAGKLHASWVKHKKFNRALTFLSSFGLTHSQVTRLIERLGNQAVGILQRNPYRIIEEVDGFGFKRADEIARKFKVKKHDAGRIEAALIYVMQRERDDGHTCIGRSALIEEANLLLIMDRLDSEELIEAGLDGLTAAGRLAEFRPAAGEPLIALPWLHGAERCIARVFRDYGRAPNPHFPDADELPAPPGLTPMQAEAFRLALRHRMICIGGCAGSGKTFLVRSIVDAYADRELDIALCAPTGKAAKRLEEMTGRPAQTIHRLLGYDGCGFVFNEGHKLDADLVAIDELSMLDVPLARSFLNAVDFERTSLLLVGDPNQLPPVGPGNVLRDILNRDLVPSIVLDQVVRQAGILKLNSLAILDGKAHPTPEGQGRKPWHLIDKYRDDSSALTFIIALYREILHERLGFDLIDDVQLLSPMYRGPLGVENLNIALQREIQKKCFGVAVADATAGKKPKFYVNDKVIHLKNNYTLDVMNGAVGRVLELSSDGKEMLVGFDDGERVYDKAAMRQLSLAFCISYHRSQGSEFPCAICIVHRAHSFMHHRNLFYTGVTRAKDTAIIIGDSWGIRNCARKKALDLRNTFLSLPGFGD